VATKKEKNNTWTASISYSINGKTYHTNKRGFESKRDAQKYEFNFRENITRKKMIKFKKAYQSFLEDKKSNRKTSTTDEIDMLYRKYLKSLDNKDIEKIRLVDYQFIKTQLVRLDLAATYKNKILSVMKSVAKYISIHYELVDWSKNVTRFVSKKVKDEMIVWSKENFDSFAPFVKVEIYRDFYRMLIMTGMRSGEGRALYKKDLANKTLSITKSIRHAKDGVTPPKNVYSRRIISIDNNTNKMLLKYQKRPGIYLFGDNEPLAETTVGRIFQKSIKRAQIEYPELKRIKMHDLRHSHASILINKGANIIAVSKRLGHSSVEITLKVYTHLMKESEDKLLEILNDDEEKEK
jgi:integrase